MPLVLRVSPQRRQRDRRAAFDVAHLRGWLTRLSPLDAVSLQVICGFVAPLPVIQAGHWLLGWPSVAVMFGGL